MSLNSFQLKWIAIVTMVIDHTGAVLFPSQIALRYIGRISFPIFCFLLVEGFFHTKDIWKYMIRLGIFAAVSEIPYDITFFGRPLEFTHQNVFFTLLLGVILMYVLEKEAERPVKVIELLLVMWLSLVLRTDYSFKGILLIFIFYILRGRLWPMLSAAGIWNFLWNRSVQWYGVFSLIPIAMYNGERGPGMKYFFYVFYPAHLLILFILKQLIM